jgi:hypothetical protein
MAEENQTKCVIDWRFLEYNCWCELPSKQVCQHHLHKPQQDRQCTYNVTLKRVRVTIIAVENQ